MAIPLLSAFALTQIGWYALRLFLTVAGFNIVFTLFLAFINYYVFPSTQAAVDSVQAFYQTSPGQLVANLFGYFKVWRCLSLFLTAIVLRISRKYILDKLYDALIPSFGNWKPN